jgi:hypothetical protein
MDEAIRTIAPQPSTVIAPAISQAQRLAQRQAQAVAVLAKRRAIAATRKRLRGMGRKPQYMPMREMAAMVEEYLDQHWPVLIAEARPIVDRWTAEGFFGKRAALSVQHLKDLHKERRPEPQALPLCENHDRNGATR